MQAPFLIAVHAGAGYHSTKQESKYKAGMVRACQAAAAALRSGSSAIVAVAAAISALEDCEEYNAGRGSNLTYGGVVECDASIMAGDSSFGAVAAVPGVSNPIHVALQLVEEQAQPLSHGRVRPMMLAGDAARAWALSRGIAAAPTPQDAAQWNVTGAARKKWQKYRSIVDGCGGSTIETRGAAAGAAGPAGAARAGAGAGGEVGRGEGGGGAGSAAAPEGGSLEHDGSGEHRAKRARLSNPPSALLPARQELHKKAAAAGPTDAGGSGSRGGSSRGGGGRGGSSSHKSRQDGNRVGSQNQDDKEGEDGEKESVGYDTVGCVVVDSWGRVAAGVSSGGIALKTEGRVGEAAVFGAGCWAQDERGARPAVACSVTGVGERIMQHLVATQCSQRVAAAVAAGGGQAEQQGASVSEECRAVLRESILKGPPPTDCGVLCVTAATSAPELGKLPESPSRHNGTAAGAAAAAAAGGSGSRPASSRGVAEPEGSEEGAALLQQEVHLELGVAHCSQSMAVGYLTHTMGQPRTTFLRRQQQPAGAQQGGLVFVKGDQVAIPSGTPLIVEFWASWCGPCRMAFPHLSELQRKYKDKGLRVVGVCLENELHHTRQFVERQGSNMDYAVAVDSRGEAGQGLMGAAGVSGIPHAFVIDARGIVRHHGHPLAPEFEKSVQQVCSEARPAAAGGGDYKAADRAFVAEQRLRRFQQQQQEQEQEQQGQSLQPQ